jgi:hypothetical protein
MTKRRCSRARYPPGPASCWSDIGWSRATPAPSPGRCRLDLLKEAKLLGAVMTVAKPFSQAKMLTAVKSALTES